MSQYNGIKKSAKTEILCETEYIKGALELGYGRKAIFEFLKKENRISMTYNHFLRMTKKLIIESQNKSEIKSTPAITPSPPKPEKEQQSGLTKEPVKPKTEDKTFQFNPSSKGIRDRLK